MPRQGFDCNADQVFQNLSSTLGLLKAASLMLRLAPRGLWFGGIPCNSFGYMSSPTHERSSMNPFGSLFPFVTTGNILCTRYVMLAVVAIIRGCVWAAEQPDRSTLEHMPPMKLLFQHFLHPLQVKWCFSRVNLQCAKLFSSKICNKLIPCSGFGP